MSELFLAEPVAPDAVPKAKLRFSMKGPQLGQVARPKSFMSFMSTGPASSLLGSLPGVQGGGKPESI